MTVNSPANTLLLYMFEVKGSVDSLLPIIWAVDAVGIGANNNELRTPYWDIFWRSVTQSHRLLGVTPHMSNCNTPWDIGEPSYELYGPDIWASSHDASTAAKYIVSNISLFNCMASELSNGYFILKIHQNSKNKWSNWWINSGIIMYIWQAWWEVLSHTCDNKPNKCK